MVLNPVSSSQIVAVGYDDDAKRMAIEFRVKNGRSVYTYENVDRETAAKIVFAESVGKAFGATLKPNADRYPFVKRTDLQNFEVASPAEELVWVEVLRPFAYKAAPTVLDGSLAGQREMN